jgi:hypothetical protein
VKRKLLAVQSSSYDSDGWSSLKCYSYSNSKQGKAKKLSEHQHSKICTVQYMVQWSCNNKGETHLISSVDVR